MLKFTQEILSVVTQLESERTKTLNSKPSASRTLFLAIQLFCLISSQRSEFPLAPHFEGKKSLHYN